MTGRCAWPGGRRYTALGQLDAARLQSWLEETERVLLTALEHA